MNATAEMTETATDFMIVGFAGSREAVEDMVSGLRQFEQGFEKKSDAFAKFMMSFSF